MVVKWIVPRVNEPKEQYEEPVGIARAHMLITSRNGMDREIHALNVKLALLTLIRDDFNAKIGDER
jgi:hypothetical protein